MKAQIILNRKSIFASHMYTCCFALKEIILARCSLRFARRVRLNKLSNACINEDTTSENNNNKVQQQKRHISIKL